MKRTLLLLPLLVGCSEAPPAEPAPTEPKPPRAVAKTSDPMPAPSAAAFTLSSTAFTHNGKMARANTKYDRNVSPALKWSNPPAGTKSFALVCDDPDAKPLCGHDWLHWAVADIPVSVAELAEGAGNSPPAMPAGSRTLTNDFGDADYGGPQPPKGTGVHHYRFTLYALNVERIALKPDADRDAIRSALAGAALAHTVLTGTFER